MKKLSFVLLSFLILSGCSSKEVKEVDYVYENRQEIVDRLLGDALPSDETNEIFQSDDSLNVYYERLDENQIDLTIHNAMDYYFTGEVDFEVCPYKVSVTALPPNSAIHQTIECPNFVDDDEYEFGGKLYNRKEDNAYNTKYEVIGYEDNSEYYDYALDLDDDEIDLDELVRLANVIYEENILLNYEGELYISVYPLEDYNEAYELDTDDAWNELDDNDLEGYIYVDVAHAMAEIYDDDMNLLERLNLK